MTQGKIEALAVYPEKGASPQRLQAVRLVQGMGIEGDFHFGPGTRQISILLKEADDFRKGSHTKGLCFEKFGENILIEGCSEDQLQTGTVLKIQDAEILIGNRKHCFAHCELYQPSHACPMARMGMFASVRKGGTVEKGDPVFILKGGAS